MVFYNDLAAYAQAQIAGLDWGPLLGDRIPEVTSRPKTIDTLRQKLQREKTTQLPSVQDIAGVRFEAEMTLDEQDAVANAIAGLFGHDLQACMKDLRENPHSGYRAVHLWLRLPARVEVQIRTHLQGQWANTYEAVADVLGRRIRYDELPEDKEARELVEALQSLSKTGIMLLEEGRVKIRRLVDRLESETHIASKASELEELRAMEAEWDETEHGVQKSLIQLKESYDKIRHTAKG
jgi:ppGpp synthetase/RelA/SpoT-type nucleotidyltranferase